MQGTSARAAAAGRTRFEVSAWMLLAALLAGLFVFPGRADATVYEVGPGKTYANINDVPLENLTAGDTLKIYYRSTPYKEKFGVFGVGTASQPIVVQGVAGPGGELPVIDGDGATTRSSQYLSFWSQARQVVKIGGSTKPVSDPDHLPAYIIVENLDIKSGRSPYTFTDRDGGQQTYADEASSWRAECGQYLTLRNCIIRDSGMGVLTSGYTYEITIEGNYILDNGQPGVENEYIHNLYTESHGILFQYNHFAPLRTDCGGINLKDRSCGTIVRYNWVEGGAREVNLVDSYDYETIRTDPRYGHDFMYGNVVIEPTDDSLGELMMYGGDMGDDTRYRKGPWKVYNNTFVSKRTSGTYLCKGRADDEVVDIFNNIIYVTAAGNTLTIRSVSGDINIGHNWLKSGYSLGGAHDDGTNITTGSPNFADINNDDYHITSGSACINAGMALPSVCLPLYDVEYHYVKHQTIESRPSDNSLDLGAYEYGSTGTLTIDTASLPDGNLGVAYSSYVHAWGGDKPYTWSISAGAMPAGWTLNASTGVISGTATQYGTFNFTVRCQDSDSPQNSTTKAYTVNVTVLPLQITTASLPNGYINVAYSQTLQASGGAPPYTWSILSGSLPPGLTLNSSSGVISGAPTASGTCNFTVRVTDSQTPTPATADKALSIVTSALSPLDITTVSLPGGAVNVAYSQQLAASGGWTPYTWSLDAGALPDGLTLSSGGLISGTPTTTGTSNFTVKVTDSQITPATDTQALSITISIVALDITTTSLAGATVNQAYSQTLAATGGQTPYTWSIDSGSPPSGLTLSSGGVISGTPVSTGMYDFTVKVTDSQTPTPATDLQALSIGVDMMVTAYGYAVRDIPYEMDNTSTGSFVTMATLQWTPQDVDDWIVLVSWDACQGSGTGGSDTAAHIIIDGAWQGHDVHRPKTGDNWFNVSTFKYLPNLSTGAHTVSIETYSQLATYHMRNTRIVAIKKGDLLTNWNATYDSETTTPLSETFASYASATFTPATAGDYLLLFSCEHYAPSDASNFIRATLNGAELDQTEIRMKRGTDFYIWSAFKVVNLAATSQTVSLDAKKETDADPHPIRRTRVAAIRLTGSRFAGAAFENADAESQTTQTAYQQKLSKTWNNPTANWKWLLMVDAELKNAATTAFTDMRGQLDDSQTFMYNHRQPWYAPDYQNALGMCVAGLSAGNHTVDIDYETTDAAQAAYIRTASFAALPLDSPLPVKITTASLPNGAVGNAYSQTLAAVGGLTPYAWSVVSGSLPAGLSLGSSTGVISGTPTTSGTSNFTVRVTDSQDPASTYDKALSIVIDAYAPLAITTASLPGGQIGVSYSQTLQATGGLLPYTWSLQSGSLPAGLSLNASTGDITGTPTTAGTSNFTAKVTDSQTPTPATATKALSIVIPADLTITTTSLPDATCGVYYSQTVAASGGVQPYNWSITYGSLPAGLSLNASTGVISGTPTSGGTSNFSVRVTDAQTPADSYDKSLSITVIIADLVINTTSLSGGYVNVSYSQTLSASGGVPPYTWSIISGTLPAGLSLNGSTGIISGTPTAAETKNFTVRVTDSQGTPDTADKALSITISTLPALDITTTSLPNGTVGVAYSQQIAATGGWQPYTWTLDSGSLPPGLSLSSGGLISGTPTTQGNYNFTVKVTDSQVVPATDTQPLSIAVALTPVDITTTSLAAGSVGSSYSQTLAATGGTTPYTWSIDSGALPPGLSLNSSTGAITGTPTQAGQFDFVAKVTDSQVPAASDTQALTIGVDRTVINNKYVLRDIPYEVDNTSSGSYVTMATLTWTPSVVDDWVLLVSWDVTQGSGTGGSDTGVKVLVDGVMEGHELHRPKTGDEWFGYSAFKFLPSLSAGSHTIQIQTYSQLATYHMRNTRIVAVRKDDLAINQNSNYESDTVQALTDAFVSYATVTFTPPSAGDYLLLFSCEHQALSDSSNFVRATLNGNALDQTELRMKRYTDMYSWTSASIVNLAASSQTVSLDAKKETDTDAHYIRRTRVIAIRLAGTRLAGTVYQAVDGLSQTSSTTFQQALSKTWSNSSANSNWLMMVSGQQANAASTCYTDTQAQIDDSTTFMGQHRQPWYPAGDWMNACGLLTAALSSGNHTVDIDFRTTDGAQQASVKYLHFIGVPLDGNAPSPVDITTTSLADGQIGVAYSQTLQATGGTTPYTWSILSGSLPAGLSLNSSTGEISGTPTTAGTSNFTARVTDAGSQTDDQALSIAIPADLVVTTSSLPDGQIGVAYSQSLAASGGKTPYSWSLDAGTLPAGLSLSSGGVISGTPTTAGTSNFTVKVTDSQTPADTATKALSIAIPADLAVTTSSLPDGQIGVAYSQNLAASGGKTPYAWSLDAGTLPAGLSLSSGGVISGTPTTAGTSNFTVKVTDSQTPADTATKALSIAIPADLVVTTSSLPDGQIGAAYSQTLAATGGVTPYTWSLVSGSLPAGLSLSSGGVISGTPTATGTSNFTVRVTDSQAPADTDDQALSITVTSGVSSTYEFAANDTEGSTTSTSWQTRTTLTFTPTVADDWIILGFAEYKGSSGSYSTLVRLQVDGADQAALTVEPKDTTDYQSFATVKVANLSAASHTITLQYASESTSATAYIRNARIVAIRKAALEIAGNAADSSVALTTTLTNYVSTSFTPASAGDYLLIASAEASARTNYSTQIQAKLGGTVLDECFYESKDNADYYTFASFSVVNCPASAQTLTVTAAKETGSTSAHNIRRARAVAIRLSGSRFTGYQSAVSDTESTTTSTSFQQKATKSWSVTTAGNWLLLSSFRLAGTSASYSAEGRVQVDDATTCAQPLREPQDTTDYMSAGSVDVRSLAVGSRLMDIDYRSESASATAKIRYVHLVALPL